MESKKTTKEHKQQISLKAQIRFCREAKWQLCAQLREVKKTKKASIEILSKGLGQQLKETGPTSKLMMKAQPCCESGHSVFQKTSQCGKKMMQYKQS